MFRTRLVHIGLLPNWFLKPKNQNMMRHHFLVLAACFSTAAQSQTQITEGVYGTNLHLTDTLGAKENAGGHLDKFFWRPVNSGEDYMVQLNSKWMRYGGIDYEKEFLLDGRSLGAGFNHDQCVQDLVVKAKHCRRYNIEPLFTLPMDTSQDLGPGLTTFEQMAGEVAHMVKKVNAQLVTDGVAPVLNWVYSNEPEDGGGVHLYEDTFTAETIFRYTKALHDSVMAHWDANWGTPKFIGPELYAYDNWNHGTGKVNRLVDQLTGHWSPFTTMNPDTFSILPFIDVFSFHIYPTGDQHNTGTGDFVKATKQNVIDYARVGSFQANNNQISSLEANLTQLNSRLAAFNTVNSTNIKAAITEANLCHINAVGGNVDVPEAADTSATGTSANSFIAGQWLAEVMGVCMDKNTDFNFWSSLEGSSGSNYETDIGFLYGNSAVRGARKPTYWHFKLLADNFRGNFHWGTYNHNSVSPAPTFAGNGVKVLAAAQPAGFKVMILNHNDDDYSYRVNLGATGDTPGRITVNLPSSMFSNFTMNTTIHNMDSLLEAHSTVILTFDCHGDLITRYEYTEDDASNSGQPHLRQVGRIFTEPVTIHCDHAGISGSIATSTVYTNDTVYVTGDLTIPQGRTLAFENCLVVMAAGAKIIGENRTNLTIKNTGMIGCNMQQWEGINMDGNWLGASEFLTIDSSYIINANNPVFTDHLHMVDIKQTVMVNGQTAIRMEYNKEFHIERNLIGYYREGIFTQNTQGGYPSTIAMNRMFDMENTMSFNSDNHNGLDISCNELWFRHRGIKASNSTIQNQGTSAMSAGNAFINNLAANPEGYIESSGGPGFVYNYGASQAAQFTYPDVIIGNATPNQASQEPLCVYGFTHDCPAWIPTGIEDHGTPEASIIVYPNPSTGAFTLNYPEGKGEYQLTIYDLMGRMIERRTLNLDSEKKANFEIKTRGMYIVTLQNEGSAHTQKIIVD